MYIVRINDNNSSDTNNNTSNDNNTLGMKISMILDCRFSWL